MRRVLLKRDDIYKGYLILVNSKYKIKYDDNYENLEQFSNKYDDIFLDKTVNKYLQIVFSKINSLNKIVPVSGYRSLDEQEDIYFNSIKENGEEFYSDPRCLTLYELFIVFSLPKDWNIPDETPELLIRQCIGESIPPLMLKEIVGMIGKTNMEQKSKIKAISVFSSAGIGELLLNKTNVEVIAGNELLPKRAECYQHFYPNAEMYCGDITKQETKEHMISIVKENGVKMLIAKQPCKGLSTLGKNKKQVHYEKDKRNYLILETFEIIDKCDFDYILIENVPTFIEMYFPYENDYLLLEDILTKRYADKYKIEIRVLNAKDYGICQSRPRAIIKLFKHGFLGIMLNLRTKEPFWR